jgi:hypothetical protein
MFDELKVRAKNMRADLPMELVMDCLVQNWHGPGTRYSPKDFSILIGVSIDTILTSFLLLQGEPLHLLEGHWVFQDGERELPISRETLEQVMRAQEFKHPETGEPVLDYLQSIGLVYESGETLNNLMRGVESHHD